MEALGKLYKTTLPEFGEFALPGNLLIHNPSMSILKNMENSGLNIRELDDAFIIMQALQLKRQLIEMFGKTGQRGGSANQPSLEKIVNEIKAIPAEEIVHIPTYTNADLEKITNEVIDTAGSLPEVRIGCMPPAELYKSQPLYLEKRQKDISVSNRLLAIMSVVDESDEPLETKAARILSKYNQQYEEIQQENRQFGGAAPNNDALVPPPSAEEFRVTSDKIKEMFAEAKKALLSQPNIKSGNDEVLMQKLVANLEQQLIFIKAEAHWKFYTKNPNTKVRTREEYLDYLRWNTTREFAEIEKVAAAAKALKESHETTLFVMKLLSATAHIGIGVWANHELNKLNIVGKHKRMVNKERAAEARSKGWLAMAHNASTGAIFAGKAAPSKDEVHTDSLSLVQTFHNKRKMEIVMDAARPSVQLCVEAATDDPFVIATSKALLNEVGDQLQAEANKALEMASKQYAKTCQEFAASNMNYEASRAYARGVFMAAVGGVLTVATGGTSLFVCAGALTAFAGKAVLTSQAYEATHAQAETIRSQAINQLVCEGEKLTAHKETLERQITDGKALLASQGKIADERLESLQKAFKKAYAMSIKNEADKAAALKANVDENQRIEDEIKRRIEERAEEQRKADELKATTEAKVISNSESAGVSSQTFAAAMEAKAASDKMVAQLQIAAADPVLAQSLNIEGRGLEAAKAQEKQLAASANAAAATATANAAPAAAAAAAAAGGGRIGGAGSPNVTKNAPYFKILDKENEEINKYNQLFKQIDERNEKLAALIIKQKQLVPPDAELIVNALRHRPTKGGAASQPNSNLSEAVRFFNSGKLLLESKGVKLNTGTTIHQRGGSSTGNVVNVPPMYEIFLLSSNVLHPNAVKLAFSMINGIDNAATGLEEFSKTFLSASQSNPQGGSLYDTKKFKGYRASGKKHTRKGVHYKS